MSPIEQIAELMYTHNIKLSEVTKFLSEDPFIGNDEKLDLITEFLMES